jgi:type VI secretion system secreted protein VgrG
MEVPPPFANKAKELAAQQAQKLNETVSALTSGVAFPDVSALLTDPTASAFNQNNRLITLELDSGKIAAEQLVPQSVEGTEALGEPYCFEITCFSPNANIELKTLAGLPARLGILTAAGSKVLRCGVITSIDNFGSDGGATCYVLTFEPPFALLKQRYTSRVFQDKTVPEIVQTILDEHIAANPLFAANFAYRFELFDEESYPARSYCLQYRETDFEFINRLLREEGITYRFEHTEAESGSGPADADEAEGETELKIKFKWDAPKPAPDSHPLVTFVAFDDPASLPQAGQHRIRFHRADATEADDVITDWTGERQLGVGQSTLESYEYKAVTTLVSEAETETEQGELGFDAQSTLEDYDYQAPYYGTEEDMERYARLRQQAHDRRKKTFHGEGTVRQLQAGCWFEMTEHPLISNRGQKECEFVVERLALIAHNNLPGGDKTAPQDLPPPYRITLQAQRRDIPLVPDYSHTTHAKPRALGPQTATVVGPAQGPNAEATLPMPDEVYTDALGRIRIQFHWPRDAEHPEFGAAWDEKSSCWIRVVYPSAGAGWGHQFIPRIGQEVVVDFLEHDIDRPVVVSVVHNGSHPPPTFSGAGSLPANRALSGVKTKEHEGNQYGELLFDDTPNEVRTKLSSEHGKTQLNQGYLIYPRQDGEGAPRGEGYEVRTDRHGAVRAGHGLFITTEASPHASGNQLERRDAQAQLDSAWKIAHEHSNSAAAQEGDPTETGPEFLDEEGQPEDTPDSPHGHLDHMVGAIQSWEAGTNTDPESNSADNQPGRQPVLLASAPDGVGITTDAEMVLASKGNLDTVTHRDTQQTTLKRWIHNVAKKISLFVGGDKDATSMKLTTAKGDAHLYAQSNDVVIMGDENVRVTANKGQLLISAEEEVILKCGGAFIQLKGGNINFGSPDVQSFKANYYAQSGPTSMDVPHPVMPNENMSWVEVESYWDDLWHTPWPLENVEMKKDNKIVAKSLRVDHNEQEKN